MLNSVKQKPRTVLTYMSVLNMKSKQTQKLFRCTINNIESFGRISLKDISQYAEDDIYDLLQKWICWNHNRGITTASIRCYLNAFRSYLWYSGTRLDTRDMQHNLSFPKMLFEETQPITPDMIRKILLVSKPGFRFQLLSLLSSGMRVGELGQIRLQDLDLSRPNIMVRIPAHITKTGRSRTTFFSRQVSKMIRYRIKKSDLVFCGDRTPEQAQNLIIKRFASARKQSGITERHNHCKQNRYRIHVNSLRSYFVTRANQIQFGLGHILAGHNFYMKQYNQYTVEELLDMYRKFEDTITFHKTLLP